MNEIAFEDILKEEGLKTPIQSKLELIELVRRGISKKTILKLTDLLGISLKDFAELLPVTERTIQRYSENRRFKREVSEHVILIAEVLIKGMEVFENKEGMNKWMKTPNRSISEMRPIDLLDTSFGIQLIMDVLGRLEHGVYS